MLHHNVDYTPYEGMKLKGWPEVVLSRGEIVVEAGAIVGKAGRGKFLTCNRPEPAPYGAGAAEPAEKRPKNI